MKRYIRLLIFSFCFLNAGLNQPRCAEIITWKDCLKEAKTNNPDLLSAAERLNQTRASRLSTKSSLLPQINGEVSGRTSKTESMAQSDSYSCSVSGRQLLFDGFKTFNDLSSATEEVQSAYYQYLVTSADVRLRLRTAFVRLLNAQELVQITEDIAGRRKRNVQMVKLRYEAGREHKGSLLTAQADLAQAEFEVSQAKRNIELAERRLNQELGRQEFKPVNVSGDFELNYQSREKPDFEQLSEGNPLLKELLARKEVTRLRLKSVQAGYYPQIYASAGAGKSSGEWPPDESQWSAGASLSLPIFEGGRQKADVLKAGAAYRQVQADERSGRDGVILALEENWIALQDSIDKIEVQKKFVSAVEERSKIAEAQYSAGLLSFDAWTIIEDDLARIKKSYLDARTNALIAEADWRQAKGEVLNEE